MNGHEQRQREAQQIGRVGRHIRAQVEDAFDGKILVVDITIAE